MASSNGTTAPPTTSSAVAASSSTRPDPNAHKTAPDRILIPYNQVGRRSTTLSDTSSTRSILSSSSSSSSSSASSILPTFRSIQRSHFFQFCATVLLLFIVPLVVLVAYRKEFRSDAFAIGVAAFLASETLRQIVFDLVTPPTATRYRVPAAEYENLVLDDDPRDISSPSIVHRHHHDDHDHEDEDDGPFPPAQSSPAIPTLVYSIAQEALRLGAVAVIVRLLPTEVPLAASSSATDSLIPLPPPSHPSDPSAPPTHSGGGDLPPLDPLFWSALWLALGWAGAEILWGSKRLWNQLQLYRDVLPLYPEQVHEGQGEHGAGERDVLLGVPTAADYGATGESNGAAERAYARDDGPVTNADWLEYAARWPHPPRRQDDDLEQGTARQTYSFDGHEEEEEEEEAEWDFEYRVREAQRDELEEQLGVPLYEVPVGIIFIWRLDSLLLSLVFTLFLALPFRLSPPSLFHFPLYPTFALVSLTHALLSYAWVARVRKVGIPSISYASLIVLVALTFAALGSWGVLV